MLYECVVNKKRYKKLQTEHASFMSWGEHLDNNKCIFIPFNYPRGNHYVCAMLWESKFIPTKDKEKKPVKKPCYRLRIFNSIQKYAMNDDKRIAKSITAWAHILGLKLEEMPIIDITGTAPIPYGQRENKNLCGIHVAVRAWVVASEQYKHKTRINAPVVDAMRMQAIAWLLKKDPAMCYKVTTLERAFQGSTKTGRKTVINLSDTPDKDDSETTS